MEFLPSFKSAKSLALVAATIATAIAASNMTSTLAQTTPAALDLVKNAPQKIAQNSTQPGSISFSNSGPNLLTRFYVKYTVDGKSSTFESDSIIAPGKVRFAIPPQATNVVAIGKYFFQLQQPILFETPINPSSNVCFKLFRNGPFPFSPVSFDNSCTDIAVTPITPPAPAPKPPEPPLFQTFGLPASLPSRIIVAPGKPQLVIFNRLQAFKIGCLPLRALWDPMPTIQVDQNQYQSALNLFDGRSYLAGELPCNSPNRVKGYTSPAFTPYAGVIVTDGSPFAVSSSAFFGAIGITPQSLSDEAGRRFLREKADVFKNAMLVTNR